jgi:hypothetical protein
MIDQYPSVPITQNDCIRAYNLGRSIKCLYMCLAWFGRSLPVRLHCAERVHLVLVASLCRQHEKLVTNQYYLLGLELDVHNILLYILPNIAFFRFRKPFGAKRMESTAKLSISLIRSLFFRERFMRLFLHIISSWHAISGPPYT